MKRGGFHVPGGQELAFVNNDAIFDRSRLVKKTKVPLFRWCMFGTAEASERPNEKRRKSDLVCFAVVHFFDSPRDTHSG